MKRMFHPSLLAVSVLCGLSARAETEWGQTGDLRGFRYKGEPIELTTSIRMSSPGRLPNRPGPVAVHRAHRHETAIYRQPRLFGAAGGSRGARGGRGGRGGWRRRAGGVSLRVQIDDTATDTTTFDVQASANTAIPLDGIYYWFNLAGANFAAGSAEFRPVRRRCRSRQVSLASLPAGSTRYADATVKSIRITGAANRVVEFTFANPTHIVLQETRGGGRGGRGGWRRWRRQRAGGRRRSTTTS